MKKIILALWLTLFISAAAHTANLYILYDPACMDRLEYVAFDGKDKSEYIVYHVNTSPGEKVVLEVGPESSTMQEFPPAQMIKCNSSAFNKELVNIINSNIEQVYMAVRKGNNQYSISPISVAARYLRSEDFILYDSPKYRFQFDTKRGTIGENIAPEKAKAQVHFLGIMDNECSGTLLFEQKAEFAGNPHTNIELIPEVGVVEERSGINAADAMNNVIRLEKVNGKKLNRYLRKLCKGIEEPEEPVVMDNTGDPGEAFITTEPKVESLTPKGDSSAPAPAPAANAYHTVKKGETLYRLSKKYGVTVAQIREWNGKGNSNTIYAGENLQVAPRSAGSGAATREGQIQVLGAPSGYEETPAPAARPAAAPQLIPRGGTQKYHVVQRGETIASIAMKYGYTDSRFREFNNLGPNAVAMIGQQLKTTDCDCLQDTANGAVNTPQRPATTDSYSSTSPRIIGGSNAYQPTGNTQSFTQRGTTGAGTTGESFYEDGLAPSRDVNKEYYFRNTPLFLDQAGAPPATSRPATPITTRTTTAAPSATQGRTYSADGDFYSVTTGRIDSQPTTGSTANTTSKGLISGSFSSRTPAAAEDIPGEYGSILSRPQENTMNTSSRAVNDGAHRVYVVQEGDTLYSIARKYGISVEQLRSINNLGAGEVIIPYQRIYLN